jgi:hypothetical protein
LYCATGWEEVRTQLLKHLPECEIWDDPDEDEDDNLDEDESDLDEEESNLDEDEDEDEQIPYNGPTLNQ